MMTFIDSLTDLIGKRKNDLLKCCKCSDSNQRFVIRYLNPIKKESTPGSDPLNSAAIGYAKVFDEFVCQKYLCALNDCDVDEYRMSFSAFRSGFSDITVDENKYWAFITDDTKGAMSLLIEKRIKPIVVNDEKEQVIYIINQRYIPHFESSKEGVHVSLEYMRDDRNHYVTEAKSMMSARRVEEYGNGRLLVIEPYLNMVYNSSAKVLKIIIDEKEMDNNDCINNFLKH